MLLDLSARALNFCRCKIFQNDGGGGDVAYIEVQRFLDRFQELLRVYGVDGVSYQALKW